MTGVPGTPAARAPDPIAAFFVDLARNGHEPLLHMVRGRLAFALSNGARTQHWLLTITNGDVAVSRGRATPDCAVRVARDLFLRMLNGTVHPWTAYLREEYEVSGDLDLLVAFLRLLPVQAAAADHPSPDPRHSESQA